MNKMFALICGALLLTACSEDAPENPGEGGGTTPPGNQESPTWHLDWCDDFNGTEIDYSVWSKTDSGTPDWQKPQSKDERCFELANGVLKLKGIVNDDLASDSRQYLCGGIWSKGKKAFGPGSIQVRARLGKGAQGAWPAIWMMPFTSEKGWPDDGEIDIMERLNFDRCIYQTLHTNYTYNMGIKDPMNSLTSGIDANKFNIFEVQIWENEVVFYVNHQKTFSYPKVNGGANGQFPFYKDWYLIIDMQLGGSWVGSVNPADLPVEMEIDWVKYYRYY